MWFFWSPSPRTSGFSCVSWWQQVAAKNAFLRHRVVIKMDQGLYSKPWRWRSKIKSGLSKLKLKQAAPQADATSFSREVHDEPEAEAGGSLCPEAEEVFHDIRCFRPGSYFCCNLDTPISSAVGFKLFLAVSLGYYMLVTVYDIYSICMTFG